MSVEAARASVYKMAIEDDAHFEPRQREANELLDRLILEVQAEMPCYMPYGQMCTPGPIIRNGPCPSCTARMKLEETADAR